MKFHYKYFQFLGYAMMHTKLYLGREERPKLIQFLVGNGAQIFILTGADVDFNPSGPMCMSCN